MANYICLSTSGDGYDNLALDEWLLEKIGSDDLILYFYVNDNAVIIGRNQNPFAECALDRMKEDGVQLVRRPSGGGAVYHDGGNLNFSFIAGENRYDKDAQHLLVLETVRRLGIPCAFSGRNDLLADGKKFSGNAYCSRGGRHLHHGTLLVCSDLSRVARYLTPDPRKMKSKGVGSVRSRVCTLDEFLPGLDVATLRRALVESFVGRYGDCTPVVLTEGDRKEIETLRALRASESWVYGQTPPFDREFSFRCAFGGVQILLSVRGGIVDGVKAYSDANDVTVCERIESCLSGVTFDHASIAGALTAGGDGDLTAVALELAKEEF